MKKKLLAIIATAAMVVTMIPSMVFADSANVAQIGSQGYPSLQAAIDAAGDGDVITVIDDIDLAKTALQVLDDEYDTYFKVEGKTITVDLNGKTISGEYTTENKMLVGVFSTDNNGHLTLTGAGTIDAKTASSSTIYTLIANYEPGCSITIENGTYKLDKAIDCLIYSGSNHDQNKNEGVEVKGGTFILENVGSTNTNGMPWIFNVLGQNERHVWVTGGTFNADVNHQYWIFEVQAPKEKALKNNGDGTWTIVDAVAYVDEWNKSGKWYDKEVGYATLKEAVDAVNTRGKAEQAGKDSEKITLLKDAKISDTLHFMKNTNLDLNGKKIIWEGKDDTPIVSFDEGVVISDFEPSKVGYTFKGWYTDAKYENAWNWDFESLNSQTRATANVTSLYAKWTEAPVPEKSPDTGDNSLPYTLAVAGLALAAMAAVVATRRRTN